MPLLKVNYIFNECYFKITSLLIWINAIIFEMLLSYFVYHQDKVDSSFCGRMFHPPLLAVIVSFLPLLKQGYLFNLLLLRHFASLRETLCLISVQLHKTTLDFLFVLVDSYYMLVFSWKVSTSLHPHDRAVCFEMLCYLYSYYFK